MESYRRFWVRQLDALAFEIIRGREERAAEEDAQQPTDADPPGDGRVPAGPGVPAEP